MDSFSLKNLGLFSCMYTGQHLQYQRYLQNCNSIFRQEKTKKKKCSLSNSSNDNIDDDNSDDNSATKSKKSMEINNISQLNSYDLDEYLGGEWERKTISKIVATPPVDLLAIFNTIDLNVLMESDEEPVIETVIIHECRHFTMEIIEVIFKISTTFEILYSSQI